MKHLLIISILMLLTNGTFGANGKKNIDEKNDIWKTVFDVPFVSENINVDGLIKEKIWTLATPINKFYNSVDARPAKTDANIGMLFNNENLIFSIKTPKIKYDGQLKKCFLSDEFDLRLVPNISIYLEPGHNHGVYYRFIIDFKGDKQDLCVDDESWGMEWSAAINESDGYFTAEIKIPVEKLHATVMEGDIWGFNVTLNGINGKESASATPVKIRLADANNFGHLLFKGNLNSSELAGIKKSLPETHHKQYKDKLAANTAMCGPQFTEIKTKLDGLSVGKELTLKSGTKIMCIGLDNNDVVRSDYPFFYEKFENEQLQRLRKQYNLEDIIAPGKNDFEKLLLLNEWLYTHVKFGSPPPMRPNALQVLYYGLNGQTFYCTYLSFTLMQMYTSLGYTARKLTSEGHGTLDVWSDYWGKWIQIDPSRHSYYRLKQTGIPLNSNEIRREYWKNGGVDMEMVFGTEQRAEQVTLETREKDGLMRYRPDSYAWIAYKSRNNFFEVPFAYWNYDYLIVEDEFNKDEKWMSGDDIDVREVLGTRTNRVGDIFWTLNQAHIHLYDEGSNTLKVQLETVTPNFETFEYAVDKGEWKKAEAIFNWELHKGQNFLYARSVNKFGIKGHEHKIVLRVE